MKTTLLFRYICIVAFICTSSISLSSAASLEGIPDQESFVDGSSTNWAHTPVHVRRSVQYCGTRLVDAIRNICKGNTYAPLSRRSDPSFTGDYLLFTGDIK